MLAVITVSAWLLLASVAYAATPQNVYRFYNVNNGSHFYTASNEEWWNVSTLYPSIYRYEGIAWTLDASSPYANQPLHRFYNLKNGTHFYTASEDEKRYVILSLSSTYRYEGVAYYVSATACPDSIAIYRFYYKPLGSHFYTASADEANRIIATYSSIYTFEGTAFWVPVTTAAPAPRKTARNYCNSWNAIGAGSFWDVAGAATPFQQARGFSVYSNSGVLADSIYNDMQSQGIVIAASHASPGRQVYRSSGGVWTCVATSYQGTHSHYVDGYSSECQGSKNLSRLRGLNSPTRMIIWMGCSTGIDPAGDANSLPVESSLAGVDHNAGFNESIYMNTWATDYAYGYWKALSEAKLTSTAMDEGTSRTILTHFGIGGGYSSHMFVGSDIRL